MTSHLTVLKICPVIGQHVFSFMTLHSKGSTDICNTFEKKHLFTQIKEYAVSELKIGLLSLYILWEVSFPLRPAAKFQKEGKYGAKLSFICVTTLEKMAHIKTIFCGDPHHFPPRLSVLEDQHIRENYFAFLAIPCSNFFPFSLFWLWEPSY